MTDLYIGDKEPIKVTRNDCFNHTIIEYSVIYDNDIYKNTISIWDDGEIGVSFEDPQYDLIPKEVVYEMFKYMTLQDQNDED